MEEETARVTRRPNARMQPPHEQMLSREHASTGTTGCFTAGSCRKLEASSAAGVTCFAETPLRLSEQVVDFHSLQLLQDGAG